MNLKPDHGYGVLDNPGTNRIQDNIATKLEQVGILLHSYGFEPPLKDTPKHSASHIFISDAD